MDNVPSKIGFVQPNLWDGHVANTWSNHLQIKSIKYVRISFSSKIVVQNWLKRVKNLPKHSSG